MPFAGSVPDRLRDDARWRLAQDVVAGPHFARSPLLSKFLLYVVAEALEGRESSLTEHKIGVVVFGRPSSYRTEKDNIVRNYARQLRKRLAEHFAGVGESSSIHIHIAVGGYVPSFVPVPGSGPDAAKAEQPDRAPAGLPAERETISILSYSPNEAPSWVPIRRFGAILAILACGLALFSAGWLAASHRESPNRATDPSRALWKAILTGSATTYVVPPDAGLNLLEDMSDHAMPLGNYIQGSSPENADVRLNSHAQLDLRYQQYTDFVSFQFVAMLARQPEFDPQRVLLRFPRDLRMEDLKNANAVIIGSAASNPWATLVDSSTNFRIVLSPDMKGASILNAHPLPGEAGSYSSHWDEPAHETYALVLSVPNLSGSGHLLALEGLDAAGTQAATEALFHPEFLAPILNRARRSDGSLRPFEILLRTTSIQSNAEGTRVIASRIH